jgi:predicted peptidase
MKKLITISLMLLSLTATAQDLSLYQKREYTNSSGNILPYRILYPEPYDKSKKYPLILFLHGAGERGNDNELQLTHGAGLFLQTENRAKFPCFVIFPQCPAEGFWASVKVDRTKRPLAIEFDYTSAATTPLLSTIEVVRKTIADESVDQSQLYIMCLSMGGMGTFEAVSRYPDMFAAAAPICGVGDTNHYNKETKKTAFWVFHGSDDPVVDVKNSRDMVNKLKALKADIKYTEYPAVAHDSWNNAFAEPELLPWLFSHKRKKVKI